MFSTRKPNLKPSSSHDRSTTCIKKMASIRCRFSRTSCTMLKAITSYRCRSKSDQISFRWATSLAKQRKRIHFKKATKNKNNSTSHPCSSITQTPSVQHKLSQENERKSDLLVSERRSCQQFVQSNKLIMSWQLCSMQVLRLLPTTTRWILFLNLHLSKIIKFLNIILTALINSLISVN